MASRKDAQDGERFRVKPAAPRSRAGLGSQRFVSQVLKATSKAGAKASGGRSGRPASTFGRGRVVAGIAGRRLAANGRRVVIKSRFVVLKKAAASSTATHLHYIERDGVTRDGQRGQAYGATTDAADLKTFEERGRGDRHQFRFIVSVEDAEQLEDLRGYTRELMQRMEVDLETRLDWVAVDHWDTDNPHTHVVLRGRIGEGRAGRDLVIAPDYMAHGMRIRASEIATEWLGPRTELEIRRGLMREVEQERFTSLDGSLMRQMVGNIVDLTESSPIDKSTRQRMLRARLQRLETMALAERIDANRWRLVPHVAQTLTDLSERGDVLRTMNRALKGERRELATDTTPSKALIGRIVAKGLADELDDRGFLVIDGIDGRAHYLKLPAGADLGALPLGGIVETKPPAQERAVDRHIAASARGGIYRAADHLAQLKQSNDPHPQATVDAHVRRLEALRRTGVVDRMADGIWKIPPDLMQKAQQHDARKASDHLIALRSHLPIEQQVRAIGATWLDRNLVIGMSVADQGFGAQTRNAMRARVDFLVEHGLAERIGRRVVLARGLLAVLRDRELALSGRALQGQTGLIYCSAPEGERVSGVYRRSVQLVSGRFAMLDDGHGFSLVPWRPITDKYLGQRISAVVRGSSTTWSFGKSRAIGN